MQKHTEEFKQEAVRIALSKGLSQRRIAADLGVGLLTPKKSNGSDRVSVYRPTDLVAALAKQVWPRRTNGFALRTVSSRSKGIS